MKHYQVDMMFCLLCAICGKVTDNSVVSVIMSIFSAVFALLGMIEIYVDYKAVEKVGSEDESK